MKQPKIIHISNKETGQVLAREVVLADTFWRRLQGLLGKRKLEQGKDGLILLPCRAVHTIGMLFPLDLLFVSNAGEILQAFPSFPPWRFSPCVRAARYVVELPPGTIAVTGTQAGQHLLMQEEARDSKQKTRKAKSRK